MANKPERTPTPEWSNREVNGRVMIASVCALRALFNLGTLSCPEPVFWSLSGNLSGPRIMSNHLVDAIKLVKNV